MTKKELKELLAASLEQARNTAIKSSAGYIAYNPDRKKERERDLMIECCGINNLYYTILEQINRLKID